MKTLVTALGLALAAAAVQADSLALSSPMAGGTISTDTIDMSVYWTPAGEQAEVVAYFTPRSGDAEPARLIMALADGDRTTFGLPGVQGVAYSFERSGDVVRVTTAPTRYQVAQN